MRVLLNLSRFQFSKATAGKGPPFSFMRSRHQFYFFISRLFFFVYFYCFLFFFIYSFVSSFYFYFWPMYSLNMFMTHSKRILRLQLRFVSGSRKFRYTSQAARAFQKLVNAQFFEIFFFSFRFTYFGSPTSFDFKGVLNECLIRE